MVQSLFRIICFVIAISKVMLCSGRHNNKQNFRRTDWQVDELVFVSDDMNNYTCHKKNKKNTPVHNNQQHKINTARK